jgi:hypothetical protein
MLMISLLCKSWIKGIVNREVTSVFYFLILEANVAIILVLLIRIYSIIYLIMVMIPVCAVMICVMTLQFLLLDFLILLRC